MVDKEKILAGREAVDTYQEAHRQLHSVPWHPGFPDEHTLIQQELTERLNLAGFDSIEAYEETLADYYNTSLTFERTQPKKVTGLIIDCKIPSVRGAWQVVDGTYDLILILSRTQNEAVIPSIGSAEQYVDLDFCQANNIAVTRESLSNYRDISYFCPVNGVTLRMAVEKDFFISQWMGLRLLQLAIIDSCRCFNLETFVTHNDIVTTGGKKVAGAVCRDLDEIMKATEFPVPALNRQNHYLATSTVNLALDTELPTRAVKNMHREASGMTSIEAETGVLISKEAFKQAFLDNLATRFNLQIEEE